MTDTSPSHNSEPSQKLPPVSFWRALSFNVVSAIFPFVFGLTYLCCFAFSLRVRNKVIRGGMTIILWFSKVILKLDYVVEGQIPEGEVIIASKHQSYWETLSFNCILNAPTFILKHELLYVPFWGLAAWRHGLIFVKRGGGTQTVKNMLNEARRKFIGTGRPLVIYPEGTRRPPFAEPTYKRGVAFLYSNLNRPVVPVALNSGMYWGRRSFLKSSGTIRVSFLEPIPAGLKPQDMLVRMEAAIETEAERLCQLALDESRKNL